jgi:predicted MFS family arabinose efflux permease
VVTTRRTQAERDDDAHVRRRAWLALTVVLFAVAFGTNVPTPLLLLYRERLGLAPTTLTAIFGVYAAGLVPALLLAGPASDRFGRRPVTAPFVLLSAVASALFLPAAASVPLLFVARFLQGAVSGVVFSVGSAWLTELSDPDHPGSAARRAAVALSGGWALGPLSAGLLAQWAPVPAAMPYLAHLALMLVGIGAFWSVPETLRERRRGPAVNLGIPPGAGRAFGLFVVPAGLAVFTFPSVSITVLPLLLADTMRGFGLAVTGGVAGVTMLAGVVVQPLGRRLGAVRAAPSGAAAGTIGLALGLVARSADAWVLLAPVAVLLGVGYGLCLAAGLTATEWLAAPDARGALTASFYGVAYLGFAAPFALSVAARSVGFGPALAVLTAAAALLTLALAAGPGRAALLRASPLPVTRRAVR